MLPKSIRRSRFKKMILLLAIILLAGTSDFPVLAAAADAAAETTQAASDETTVETVLTAVEDTDTNATQATTSGTAGTVAEAAGKYPAIAAEPAAAKLAAGMLHSAMINYDGQLYVWGDNTYGQLGFSGTDYQDNPHLLKFPHQVAAVSLGLYHSLVVLEDGTVWSFGRNAFGQLGAGGTENASKPVQIKGLPAIKNVAAGAWHSLALGEDGSVWAWGSNSNGQVGDVSCETIKDANGNVIGSRCVSPVEIISGDAVAIAAGGLHSMYLNENGEVYAWGDNSRGQLGDGTTQSRATPAVVQGLPAITAIAAGYQHSLAIGSISGYDELLVWGDDSLGQLGSGILPSVDNYQSLPKRIDVTGDEIAENDLIVAIRAGYSQSAAIVPLIRPDGTVDAERQQLLVWGSNTYGQLGLGQRGSQNVPTAVSGTFNNWTGDNFLPFDDVAIGGYHMLALSSKGLLAATGRGDRGQLGNWSILDRGQLTPVNVPDVIRPVWLDGCQLRTFFSGGSELAVRWPAAQDNRVVTHYKLVLRSSDGRTREADAGSLLTWTFQSVDPRLAYEVTVMACDADSVEASAVTLSRLVGYQLPEEPAAGGKILADYFPDSQESVWQADFCAHHWQPDPQNLLRPLEVPWETGTIYGKQNLPSPADWQGFKYAALAAGVLLLMVLLDLLNRKIRRMVLQPLLPLNTRRHQKAR